MYVNSNPPAHPDPGGAQAVKLLIAGGFGAGKTTLVSAVSEIKPLRTEERLSEIGAPVDDLTGVAGKTTTTVALDFGRITINPEVVLYLFGTPGQDRFWFMWKELSAGALGAVVLADTRRLADCFGAVDFFESRDIPFIVAVNCFDDADIYHEDEVRHALDIGSHVPIQFCDARDRGSGKQVLVQLLEYLMATATARLGNRLPPAGAPGYASRSSAVHQRVTRTVEPGIQLAVRVLFSPHWPQETIAGDSAPSTADAISPPSQAGHSAHRRSQARRAGPRSGDRTTRARRR